MKKYKNKGFTLVELLVVIAIIGILAAVILVSLAAQRNKAKFANVLQGVRSELPAVIDCEMRSVGANVIDVNNGGGEKMMCDGATIPFHDPSFGQFGDEAGNIGDTCNYYSNAADPDGVGPRTSYNIAFGVCCQNTGTDWAVYCTVDNAQCLQPATCDANE